MIFENKMSWNTVITGTMIVVGGILTFAEIRTQNALQDARIEANRVSFKEAIDAEKQTRRESLQEIKSRMDADRVEMRAQFSKLNDKIDELIKRQGS